MTAATFARRSRVRLDPSAEPNVIPFIDVLLVLLIIFMVTAPRPTVDLQVDMPRNAPVTPAVTTSTLVELREDAGGYRLFVSEREVALDSLAGAVMAHVRASQPVLTEQDVRAEAPIYVRSDQGVAYGNVVGVIDELRHAGFEKVSVYAQLAEET
jgi:biopolymer transport protein ExbD